MDIFGHLEQFASEVLYPYRVPITAALVVIVVAALVIAARRGWLTALGRTARARPLPTLIAGALALAIVLPVGIYLVSPLWTRSTLVEESPLLIATETTVPDVTSSATATNSAATPTPTPTTAVSTEAAPAGPVTVLEGTWMGADDFHFAEGRALVIETSPGVYVLRVEDFSVRNGPDLFVYVSPDPGGYTETALELGTLKATDGAFNYEIPEGVSLDQLKSAVVWCKAFSVLFGSAPLMMPAS